MAGGGGSEPNLTPLIDLFSVLIVFLLMTASWIQLDSLQVQVEQKAPPSSNDPVEIPQKPVEPPEKKARLSLTLFASKVVAKEDEFETVYSSSHDNPGDPTLKETLKTWKQKYPTKHNIIINSDSTASYGQLIRLYDFIVASGWSEIGISPY